MSETRIEKDQLGEMNIPKEAYYGIHTARAMDNFKISGRTVNSSLIKTIALVKKAAAETNHELKYLTDNKVKAIVTVCDEIIDGGLTGEFLVDALAGGAGTSVNMNLNEVIANRAIEILGGKKGEYSVVDPFKDVNLHQSTNDVYPTALKIACIYSLRTLSAKITALQGAFQRKEKEFAAIIKIGRTEMQEAVPITLGFEFSAFAEAVGRDRWRTFKSEERLRVVNLGGTAVGTGMGAPKSYIFQVIEKLRALSGLGISRNENVMDSTANTDSFVEVSGIMKAHAVNLIKIADDLRLLNLLGEIKLPEVQAGSSIMPGKINPVIAEAVIQTGLKVIANDGIVTAASTRGTLQINEFMPVIADAILETLDLLININDILVKYIDGITADEEKCKEYFEKSPALVTAFLPHIGYESAGRLLAEFKETKKENLHEYLIEKLGAELVEKVLSPYSLVALGYRDDAIHT
ncbi:MAG: aspartate ammonia-lyase [Candidatus Firestonebacteria bacterium RIFOXYC2_FULL_39_67]|nr:MAG: aspartate ammonia-lyase [Candidatus Firestonebacteria bacterium RIFOXYD2_FULL_39_29]OGF56579.1 MAG: aspartate ammonia-lyase [Candidatus Firestonebacteria bacterium RIFOXYC2_FULL_39_67]